jgi:hydrogenase nickel incorporation protein HypA/HybF
VARLAAEIGCAMHELSIAQSIVDAVAQRTGGAAVSNVRLTVGQLSGVVADSLRFCFELVAAGTPLEAAALQIEEPGGWAQCTACGTQFAVPDLVLLCPCGSADVRLLAGDELLIRSVELV